MIRVMSAKGTLIELEQLHSYQVHFLENTQAMSYTCHETAALASLELVWESGLALTAVLVIPVGVLAVLRKVIFVRWPLSKRLLIVI